MARIVVEIAKNAAMAVPAIRRRRSAAGRTALEPGAANIEHQVYKLVDTVALSTTVVGKSVLEIGPGDNLATGLAFLAAGARSYAALDRFPGDYGNETALAWYRTVREHWRTSWPDGLAAFPNDPRVTTIARAVEDAGDVGTFDIVCSHAVGEHVQSVAAFAGLSRRATAPGGVAVHIVDFSGHQFSDEAMHAFPEWLWRAMGSNRGLPNRVPFDEFHAIMGGEARRIGSEALFVQYQADDRPR